MQNFFQKFLLAITSLFVFISWNTQSTKEINYKGKNYEVPSSTLILNLSDTINGFSNAIQSSTLIYNTFAKAAFGDYIPKQGGNTIFEQVVIDDNFAYARLNSNLTFHNGRKVVAKDVEYSITRFFVDNKPFSISHTTNPYIPMVLSNLVGYDKAIQNAHPSWESGILSGIKAINNEYISFKLKCPDPKFFDKLNMGYFPLVAQESFQEDGKTVLDQPIGAGPYKIVKFDSINDFYLLEKTEDIQTNAPQFVAFVFTNEDLGDIKLLYNKAEQANVKVSTQFTNTFGFNFNFRSKLGADPRFRAVFDLALDRSQIAQVDSMERIVPDCQLVANSETNSKYRANCKPTDKEKARTLVQELKNELQDAFPSTLVVPVKFVEENHPLQKEVFAEVTKQLADVGLVVEFSFKKTLPFQFNVPGVSDKELYPVTFYARVLVSEDPLANFPIFIPKNCNYSDKTGYVLSCDQDAVLGQKYAEALKNPEKIKAFNEYFISQNIFVVFAHQFVNYSFNKEKILNMGNQSAGNFIDILNIQLQ